MLRGSILPYRSTQIDKENTEMCTPTLPLFMDNPYELLIAESDTNTAIYYVPMETSTYCKHMSTICISSMLPKNKLRMVNQEKNTS